MAAGWTARGPQACNGCETETVLLGEWPIVFAEVSAYQQGVRRDDEN